MSTTDKNRRFVLHFFKKISGRAKSPAILRAFIADEKLIETLCALESYLPAYQISIEEVTSEGQRVSLKALAFGPTSHLVPDRDYAEIPFALSCKIEKGKITGHWFIADRLAFLEETE